MAIAGTLAVNVIANTTKFAKGMKAATGKLTVFRAGIKKAAGVVTGFGGVLAGAIGVGSVVAFTNRTIGAIDRLNKLSDQLGISANTLQVWAHAADLGGSSLEAMTTGFKRFQRVILDAQSGLTTATRALDRLGLSSKQLLRLDPARQMELLSAALKKLPNPTIRAATAMEVLGRSGPELLPTLLGNIEKIRAEMNDWSADLSGNQISEFVDSLTRLKATLGAAGTKIIVSITPAAIDAVKTLELLFQELRGRRTAKQARAASPTLTDKITSEALTRFFVGPLFQGLFKSQQETSRLEAIRQQLLEQTQIMREQGPGTRLEAANFN